MGFSADWLALREPADHAARDAGLLRQAATAAGARPVILDLGCGTGSTARAMAPYLPEDTEWRLLDSDAALLERAKAQGVAQATYMQQDLKDVGALPLQDVTLVTASALLDLCSADWLRALAGRLSVPFYAALSYDGVMGWTPEDAQDVAITEAFNQHQRTDKGFGPALGPDAATRVAEILQEAGFEVQVAQSPWRLGPDMAELQALLTDGIAGAALEMGQAEASDWGKARVSAASRSHCVIGHVDVFAIPRKTL